LGKEVLLLEESLIDVSGKQGGGQIFVGGSFQGKDRSFVHAEKVIVHPEAVMRADAGDVGNGGSVIVWGDQVNVFFGQVSAQGGLYGGDGGLVEVSSPGYFAFHGDVKTLAPMGRAGTLLLDPPDITISNGADVNVTFGGACGALTYCTTAAGNGNVEIGAAGIVGTLLDNLTNGNVTIKTTTGSGGNGDIIIVDPITIALGTNNLLTLNASRDVTQNVGAPITNNSTLASIVFNAGLGGTGSITINDAITYNGGATGTLTMNAVSNITLSGTSSISNSSTGGVTLNANGSGISGIAAILIQGPISTVNGGFTANGTSLGAAGSSNIGVEIGANITSTGTGSITMNGIGGPGVDGNIGVLLDGGFSISAVDGAITLNGIGGAGTGSDNIGVVTNGPVTTSGTGNITLNGMGGAGTNNGIGVEPQELVEASGSGNIIMIGVGGTSAMNNIGIFIAGRGTSIDAGMGGTGNITLTGTGGTVGTGNIGLEIEGPVPIFTNNGTLSLTGSAGVGTTSGVLIDTGGVTNTIRTTSGGSIQIATFAGDFVLQGGGTLNSSADVTGNIAADLDIIGGPSGTSAIVANGDIDITAGGNIQITGGNGGSALVQNFGFPGSTQLNAGLDLILSTAAGGGSATIISLGGAPITLVVDNLFPTAPSHGTGSFQLDPGSNLGSTIATDGQVRIYTSQRSLNFINSGDVINGAPFTGSQPVGVDGPYEMWSTYFPGGAYGGPQYTIYYKEPFINPNPPNPNIIIPLTINQEVIANSQLNEWIPFYYPYHLADFIDYEGHSSEHFFPRFEAFIFSNEVY
jgi:hypothetical protein